MAFDVVKHFVEPAQDGDGDVDGVVATGLLDGGAGDGHFDELGRVAARPGESVRGVVRPKNR